MKEVEESAVIEFEFDSAEKRSQKGPDDQPMLAHQPL